LKFRYPCLLREADAVYDGDIQGRVLIGYVDIIDYDQVTEPLLEGALDKELQGSGEFVAVWLEYQLHQAAAEGRAIDPFARGGEQDLLYHVGDMPVVVAERGASFVVESEGVFNIHHVPVTLVCVTVIISGVPLGIQMAWLSSSSTGMPVEVMRVAPVTHWAVTQGNGLPAGVRKGQPATTNGIGCSTIG
jgi:hypothetical protein